MIEPYRDPVKVEGVSRLVSFVWLGYLCVLALLGHSGFASAEEKGAAAQKQVHAVLFYQPFCGVCPALIDDFLLPLTFQHIDELVLTPMPTTRPPAKRVFEKLLKQYGKKPVAVDVPVLLIGDRLLVGDQEIKQSFSELLSSAIGQGGLDLPDVAGLNALVAGGDFEADGDQHSFVALDRFLAWSVMASLLFALAYTAGNVLENGWRPIPRMPKSVSALMMVALGIAISLYLTYIEVSGGAPVCGPVGDCAAVQSSSYAKILGVPMAVLGLGYYLVVAFLWSGVGLSTESMQRRGTGVLLLFSLIGVLFSIYLTALELFIIHAVCIWCLGSAVITAVLLMIASNRLLTGDNHRTID